MTDATDQDQTVGRVIRPSVFVRKSRFMIRNVPAPTAFGERLRRERLRRNMSQREAAAKFGVSQPSYHRWERGEVSPAKPYLAPLADFIGVSMDELFQLIGTTGAPVTHAELDERIGNLERDADEYRRAIKQLADRVAALEGTATPPNRPAPRPRKKR